MKSNDRLRVLIVDDEYLIRELLKKQVDWGKVACDIVDEASCAAEVFDILEEMHVDLIITDINMPNTDGLEMSKLILESYPKIKIIILTGYDKFEYAQTGIDLGIADYILKPIQKNKIEASIIQVKETIGKERKQEFEYQFIKEKLQENLTYMRERFLLDLLHHKNSSYNLQEKLNVLQISFCPQAKYQIAIITLDQPEGNQLTEEDRLITLLGVKHMVEKYYKDKEGVYILLESNESITIFYNLDHGHLSIECDDIMGLIEDNFQYRTTIGIGEPKAVLDSVRESYQEALTALRYQAILGNHMVICYKDLDIVSGSYQALYTVSEEELEQLHFLVKAGLKGNAVDYVHKIFNHMGDGSQYEHKIFIEHVRVQATRLIAMLFYMMASLNIQNTLSGKEGEYFNAIASIGTLPHGKAIVSSLVEEMISCINGVQSHMAKDYMKDVEQYIKENISNYGLTLKKVAAYFYLNPSYLSRLFKQKMGITFKDYVSKIRMDKAVEYVRTTDMKVYEIGEAIGIPDGNYFSAMFKRYIGMSITAYKKQIEK